MARVAFKAEVDEVEWFVASPSRPCPVCQAISGCCIRADGEFACCMRTVCDWPVVTGGWLHRLEQGRAGAVLNAP
jgi:hypothetical protein